MKRKLLVFMLVMGLAVGTASAQLGSGIVYDPTNYHNALLAASFSDSKARKMHESPGWAEPLRPNTLKPDEGY